MSKSIYERVLDLRNRISSDGDDSIHEEDHLLLDEVLDLIENSGGWYPDIETQINDYNNTVDIYNEFEIGIKFKKQEKLLELYKEYFEYSEMLKDGRKFGGRMLVEHERDKIIEEIKELEND